MIRAQRTKEESRASKSHQKMSAVEYYAQETFEKEKEKNPLDFYGFDDHARKCQEDWKNLSAQEKDIYMQLAGETKGKDKPRTLPKSSVSNSAGTGKRKRSAKDPNAPKRNLSAFFHYCHEERPRVRAAYPAYSIGLVAKELGHRWSGLGAEAKSFYHRMAVNDKERYIQEKSTYETQKSAGPSSTPVDETSEMEKSNRCDNVTANAARPEPSDEESSSEERVA